MNAYLEVVVNGRLSLLPVTSTLHTVMAPLPPSELPAARSTLRIRRLFHGRYVNVCFDRDDPMLSSVILLGGDRISWSLARAGH